MASAFSASPTLWELPLPPPHLQTSVAPACISTIGPVSNNSFSSSVFSGVLSQEHKSLPNHFSNIESETTAELEQTFERVQKAALTARMEMNAEREALSAEGSRHRASLAALRGRLVEVERRRATQAVMTEEKEEGLKHEFAQAQREADDLLKELVSSKRRVAEGSAEFAIEAKCASEAATFHEELEAQNKSIASAQQELLEAQRGQFSNPVSSGMVGIAGDSRIVHARQRAEHEGRNLRSEIVSVQRQFEAMQAGCEAREFHCELLGDEISAIRVDLSTLAQGMSSGSGAVFKNSNDGIYVNNANMKHSFDQDIENPTWEAAELKVANAELRRELGASEAAASAREAALESRKAELIAAGASAGRAAVNGPPHLTATSFRKPSRTTASTGLAQILQPCMSASGRSSPPPAKSIDGQKSVTTPPMQRRGHTTPDDTCRTGSPWLSASPDSRLTAFELSVLGTTLDLSTSSASSLPHRYLDHSRSSLALADVVSKCSGCGGSMDVQDIGSSFDSFKPAPNTRQFEVKAEANELLQERKGLQEMLREVDEALVRQSKNAAASSCSSQQATQQMLEETLSLRQAHTALEATLSKVREGSVSVLSSPSTPLGSRSISSRNNQLSADGQQDLHTLSTLDSLGGSRTPVQGPESLGLNVSQELGNTRRVLENALGERRSGNADEGVRLRRFDRAPAWTNKVNDVVLSSLSADSEKGDCDKNSMLRESWASNRFETAHLHGDLQQRIAKLQQELEEAVQLQSASAKMAKSESEAFCSCQSQLEAEIALRKDLEARIAAAEGSMWAVPVAERLQKVIPDMEAKAAEEAHRARQLDEEWRERLEQSHARAGDEMQVAASCQTLLSISREEVASLHGELASEQLAFTRLQETERAAHQKTEQEVQSLRRETERRAAENAASAQECRMLADELAAANEARRTVESQLAKHQHLACSKNNQEEGNEVADSEANAIKAKDQAATSSRAKNPTSTSMRAARRILDSSSSRGSLEGEISVDVDSKRNEVDLVFATSIASRRLRSGPGASSRSSSEDVRPNVSSIALGTQDLRSHAADLKRRLASRVCEAAASRRPQSLAAPPAVASPNLPPEVASAPARRRAVSTGNSNNVAASSPAALMASARRARLQATRPKSTGGALGGGALSPPSSPESSLERLVMKNNPMLQRMRGAR